MVGGVAEVELVFEPDEGRQDVIPGPAVAAERRPAIEIVEHAPDSDLTVDGRAAAQTPAAGVRAWRLRVGAPSQDVRPAEALILRSPHEGGRVGDAHRWRS